MAAEKKPAADASQYSPLDRIPVPTAIEEDSESAWAKFEALQRGEDLPATQPASLQGSLGTGSYDTTQPQEPAPRAGASQQAALREAEERVPQKALSLGEVMVLVRRNNRACPMPGAWVEFHKLLPTRELHGRVLGAPLPITGPAWASATPMEKRLRLRDQVEWAERTGALMAAYDFLAALPEEGWLHFGE